METDQRDLVALSNPFIFIGLTDRENGIANHLGSQRRSLTGLTVGQVMQGNAVPAPMFYRYWNNRVASSKKGILKIGELLSIALVISPLPKQVTICASEATPNQSASVSAGARPLLNSKASEKD